MRKQPMVLTELQCEECGEVMTIPRKLSKQKSQGHIKHMYCPSCQLTTAFVEGGQTDSRIAFWEEWHAQFN